MTSGEKKAVLALGLVGLAAGAGVAFYYATKPAAPAPPAPGPSGPTGDSNPFPYNPAYWFGKKTGQWLTSK